MGDDYDSEEDDEDFNEGSGSNKSGSGSDSDGDSGSGGDSAMIDEEVDKDELKHLDKVDVNAARPKRRRD